MSSHRRLSKNRWTSRKKIPNYLNKKKYACLEVLLELCSNPGKIKATKSNHRLVFYHFGSDANTVSIRNVMARVSADEFIQLQTKIKPKFKNKGIIKIGKIKMIGGRGDVRRQKAFYLFKQKGKQKKNIEMSDLIRQQIYLRNTKKKINIFSYRKLVQNQKLLSFKKLTSVK